MNRLRSLLSIVFLALVATPFVHADILSHWPLDGELDDVEPAGNDGFFFGIGIDPLFGPGYDDEDPGAIILDGVGDYIELSPSVGLPISAQPQYSIAMWVNGFPQDDKRVFSEASSTQTNSLFNIGTQDGGTTGQVDIYIRTAGGTAIVGHRLSTGIAFDGNWHHITWTDDNGTAKLYIDGQLDATDFSYAKQDLQIDYSTIGAVVRPSAGTPVCCAFGGSIDDVRIYDHVLTEGEVAALVGKTCPVDGDPNFADTHCDVVFVDGPLGNVPGTYTATAFDAFDTSGDVISYTFTADDGAGTVLTVGPQIDNFANFDLGEGTWTFSVTVDDDAQCDDQAGDATCTEQVVIGCPTDGDTHCSSIEVTAGPEDNTPGTYTVAVDAEDDSGDPIMYTYTFDDGVGDPITIGPIADLSLIDALLGEGTWTITVTVDDVASCDDVADDASLSTEVVVTADPPGLISHWDFDENVDDSQAAENHGFFVGDIEPLYVEGFDGNPTGAIAFDGIDDMVEIQLNRSMPIYAHKSYTVAMWVNGDPQGDLRVYSEAYTLSDAPLVNIGTDNTGATGVADIYIRDLSGQGTGHIHSGREAFGFDLEWHHLAFVDDNGKGGIYIDGVRDAGDVFYDRPRFVMPLNTATIGGILRAVPSHWFTGAIDDVRVYNYALSADEIEALVPEPGTCPGDDGDTHCGSLDVTGPDGGFAGEYTLTASGATDDSGDPILYTFTAVSDEGRYLQSGPDVLDTATFFLCAGEWTVSVSVDDEILCHDAAADAACASQDVSVTTEMVSHWTFDAGLEDEQARNDGSFVGDVLGPTYVPDRNGTLERAIQLDGVADYVEVSGNPDGGLPIYNNCAYTVAMWVKGGPQPDFRVYSEGSSLDNTPLFNIGTQNAGETGQLDIYIRTTGATPVPHVWSTAEPFDDTWHHIAWIDEGGDARLYVDGVLDATDFRYAKPVMDLDLASIGCVLRAAPSHFFNGSIDDVRIYNYALGEAEVQLLVNPDCPGAGDADFEDTSCDGLTVEGPADGSPGTYTATATGSDGSGDTPTFSFEADNGAGTVLSTGSQAANTADFNLTPGTWTITVTVDDGPCPDNAPGATCSETVVVEEVPEGVPFVRGDTTGDGVLNITDPVKTLGSLFLGDGPLECDAAGDATDDGMLNITDPVRVLGSLFLGDGPLPPPSDCGDEPFADAGFCESYTCK